MAGINKQLSGLLELLGVQSGGRSPDIISETVRPTVDALPAYEADRLDAERNIGFLVTGAGMQQAIDVPENEVWKLIAVGGEVTSFAVAGQEAHLSFWLSGFQATGTNPLLLHSAQPNAVVAGALANTRLTFGHTLPYPVYLTAGKSILIQADTVTAVTLTIDWGVIFVRHNVS